MMVVTERHCLLGCDAMQSSASPVNFCQTAWCHIPEDGILHTLVDCLLLSSMFNPTCRCLNGLLLHVLWPFQSAVWLSDLSFVLKVRERNTVNLTRSF